MRHLLRLSALLVATVTGCTGPSPESTPSLDPAQHTASESELFARAVRARDDLAATLKSALMEELSARGPVAAIHFCAEEAAKLASQVSEAQGLRIGRTSFKRRNPANEPAEWARGAVEGRVAEVTILRRDRGLGVLFPIRLEPQCVLCHGDSAEIPVDVAAAIASRYPTDNAKGFGEGDLRGWFWVEVEASEWAPHDSSTARGGPSS